MKHFDCIQQLLYVLVIDDAGVITIALAGPYNKYRKLRGDILINNLNILLFINGRYDKEHKQAADIEQHHQEQKGKYPAQ